jgi:hypothetical protein
MIDVDGKKYNVVVVIPAGRRRYAEILTRYIEREFDVFHELDRCVWALNTGDTEDIKWLHENAARRPELHEVYAAQRGFVMKPSKVMDLSMNANIAQIQDEICHNPDVVYVRFDDDIVFISPGLIGNLAAASVRNSHAGKLFTAPLIINNGRVMPMLVTSGLLKRLNRTYDEGDCVFNEIITTDQSGASRFTTLSSTAVGTSAS